MIEDYINKNISWLPDDTVMMETFDCIDDMKCSLCRLGHDEFSEVWVNLTNGTEAIDMLDELDIPYKFCRFQSTYCEHKEWGSALDAMPDDMLMNLALGVRPIIIDFGAGKKCPRALRQGIPIAARMIAQAWDIQHSEDMYIFNRNGKPIKVGDDFARDAMRLNRRQKSRLNYFSKYIGDDVDWLDIYLMCAPSSHDNDYDYHVKQVHDGYERAVDAYGSI